MTTEPTPIPPETLAENPQPLTAEQLAPKLLSEARAQLAAVVEAVTVLSQNSALTSLAGKGFPFEESDSFLATLTAARAWLKENQ